MQNTVTALITLLQKNTKADLLHYKADLESTDYLGCTFTFNNQQYVYRKAKVTPKKVGCFVALWQRNSKGITEPFQSTAPFDFYIIEIENQDNTGYFIFPKNALIVNGILSTPTKEGKRGFRLYAPNDIVANKQASKTKAWQTNYFVSKSSFNEKSL